MFRAIDTIIFKTFHSPQIEDLQARLRTGFDVIHFVIIFVRESIVPRACHNHVIVLLNLIWRTNMSLSKRVRALYTTLQINIQE